VSTVVVTGSAGAIGSVVCAGLAERGWSVRRVDLVAGPSTRVADLTSADSEPVLASLCDGADAVVHLAATLDQEDWPTILSANIDATRRVLEAARRGGVNRFVYASSNHAVGYTPRGDDDLPADTPDRPDSFYGVSKVAGEALCRLYVDRYGLTAVSLRIGSFVPEPDSERALATWLSPADAVRLVQAALTGPATGFHPVWGISANTRAWWSPSAGAAIGYEPRDDAEMWAATFAGTETDPRVLTTVGGPNVVGRPWEDES